ncbi:MAG: tetratricopeptide repeat protein [Cyanobacteria bacterium REEB67]|nr:tetratricopeptide repeat protein [Cyanobacteria bacterium REEB67]
MSDSFLNYSPAHTDSLASWRMHLALARIAYDRGYFSAALKNYTTALHVGARLQLDEWTQSSCFLGLAKCHVELGNFDLAESLYKRVLNLDFANLSKNSFALGDDLTDLAALYLKTSHLSEAEGILKEAIVIFGSSNTSCLGLAEVQKDLAEVYLHRHELDKADATAGLALSLCDSKAGRQKKIYAETLMLLAQIASARGLLPQAEDLTERAIASFEMLTGGEHPELADFLDIAASLWAAQNQEEKCTVCRNRAAAIRKVIRTRDR